MAEIIENTTHKEVPSMSKANAGLTLGIIGTALGGLLTLGNLGHMGWRNSWNNNGWNHEGYGPYDGNREHCQVLTDEEMYLERKQAQNYIDITKDYYEGKLQFNERLTNAFFDAYKRDVDNSFKLYQYSRDNKDELSQRISELDKKVDVMAAIRPYQDALINSKIDKNALIADFNLSRRTCKMIEGQLVLPSTPEITGYGSYQNCKCGI